MNKTIIMVPSRKGTFGILHEVASTVVGAKVRVNVETVEREASKGLVDRAVVVMGAKAGKTNLNALEVFLRLKKAGLKVSLLDGWDWNVKGQIMLDPSKAKEQITRLCR